MPRAAVLSIALLLLVPALGRGQWERQATPPDIMLLLSVDFARSNAGSAAGYTFSGGAPSGRALYTIDSGATWLTAQIPDSAHALVKVQFVSGDTGYCVGAYDVPVALGSSPLRSATHRTELSAARVIGLDRHRARIGMSDTTEYRGLFLETTDHGMSWSPKGVLPESTFYLSSSSFVDARLGYATGTATLTVGTPCVVKTTDRGSTWTRLAIPDSLRELWGISFSDDTTGVAVGYAYTSGLVHGVIIRTTNGGASWQLQEFPQVNNFTDVAFADSSTCVAVGVDNDEALRSGAIYRSTDAGLNWVPAGYAPESTLVEGVTFLRGTGSGIAFGETFSLAGAPVIAWTTDGGATWRETIAGAYPEGILYGGTLVSPLTAYACGVLGWSASQSLMLRTTTGGLSDVAGGYGSEYRGYALLQNYPNPFNPTTKITFTIASHDHVSLTIHDLLGREVASLVSEELPAGTYEREWNAIGVTSGVYFYRLQAGLHVDTKKLLLIR